MKHAASRAVYRVILSLVTRDLGRSHGAEMERLFSEMIELEVGRSGRLGYASAWLAGLYDVLSHSISVRFGRPRRFGLRGSPHPKRRNVLENVSHSARLAARSHARRPLFTAAVVTTLALGIGANTAIFTVTNAVLLRPLPYPDTDRLVTVWESNPERDRTRSLVAPPTFFDLRAKTDAFSHAAAVGGETYELSGGARPERVNAVAASPGIFALLGVAMHEGSAFPREAEEPGRDHLVVLSHGFWQRWFGGDRGAIGSSITLDEQRYRVIGVLPEDFWFPEAADLWTPLSFGPEALTEGMRGARYLTVYARLAPAFSLEQARAEVGMVAEQLGRDHANNAGWTVDIRPLNDHLLGDYRRPLYLLLVAVALVLLIACANAVNLALVRAAERRHETAVRRALGAGRGRLYGDALVENLLLALTAGILGALAASWTIAPLIRLAPAEIPRIDAASIDATVAAYCFLLSVVMALALTLAGTLGYRSDGQDHALRETGPRTGQRRGHLLRRSLIVAEVALSLTLLVGAGLLVRSFIRLSQVHPGFRTEGVITASFSLPDTRYATPDDRARFYENLIGALGRVERVQAVGATTNLPMSGSSMQFGFAIDGRPDAGFGEQLTAQYHASSPGYFEAMAMALRGRPFLATDDRDAEPVAIINEALARRFWPGGDPIGDRITVVSQTGPVSRQIVGVVANVRHRGLASEPRMEVYVPLSQDPWPFATVVLSSASDGSALGPLIREQVAQLDPALPINSLLPIDRLVATWQEPLRFQLALVTTFGVLALVMTLLGLYGVVSYIVSCGSREIGIRVALGARANHVFRSVVGQGLLLALLGVVLGTGAALALTRYMSSLLYGVSPTDPATFVGIASLLLLCAVLACVVPARQATKVDPVTALRME